MINIISIKIKNMLNELKENKINLRKFNGS